MNLFKTKTYQGIRFNSKNSIVRIDTSNRYTNSTAKWVYLIIINSNTISLEPLKEFICEPYVWVFTQLRRLLPYFYSIGLHSCDDPYYGRVHAWYPVFAWNDWHLSKIERSWNGSGDGETWRPITMFQWIKWKFKLYQDKTSSV